ncbi:hypothetical protein [Hymenobacter cellulosilyticus]|uniref:Uncharacterized protein n=1 Tax=Hymenobacter cellulosilyticus TaxID=2932248 RepID=A0A8T9Q703_9BACT|nr:hypothetical protein [Hymenobacter cellulosilyticus]UOQ73314.1 hypothetical protein MUN79_04945 [Hymenobacter cellulosilyticus]
MRKGALVPRPTTEVVRLMIHDDGANGVYLFGFDTLQDTAGQWDECYETVEEAEAAAAHQYHVGPGSWQPLPDIAEHCQQDWIAPVRVQGRAEGSPQWGQFERLIAGHWVAFRPE